MIGYRVSVPSGHLGHVESSVIPAAPLPQAHPDSRCAGCGQAHAQDGDDVGDEAADECLQTVAATAEIAVKQEPLDHPGHEQGGAHEQARGDRALDVLAGPASANAGVAADARRAISGRHTGIIWTLLSAHSAIRSCRRLSCGRSLGTGRAGEKDVSGERVLRSVGRLGFGKPFGTPGWSAR